MPFTIITGDSFTSEGVGVRLKMPSSPDYFECFNVTQAAQTNPNKVIKSWWYGSKFGAGASAADTGFKVVKTTADLTSAYASGGFTYVSSVPVIEAQSANAITAITAANPAVVTQTQTYSEGDILQFYGTTGMLQIAGMNFQISSVSGSGYTLLGLQASGFAAPGTAGYTRRISKYAAVDPQFLFVTKVTKASNAVVTCSVDPSLYYVAGMKVRFSVPYSFGMTELDGLTGRIVSLDSSAYTMTVDIDSTAFTTFAFPASASSPTATLFATLAPAGVKTFVDTSVNPNVEYGYNFQFQAFKTGQFAPYMYLTAGAQAPAGAANDVINWTAWKLEN